MEKGAKVAAILSILAAAPAAAQVVLVPCDIPLARLAPVHFKPHLHHPIHRHHRHKHPVGKRGRMGFHFAISRGLCPIFYGEALLPLPEELGGPAGAEPFGGGYPIEDTSTDLGGGDFGSFGGFGGGGGGFGGDDLPPLIFISDVVPPLVVPPLIPLLPLVPVGPPIPTPIPEPSTFWLFAIGMAATCLAMLRQRLATVSRK